MESITKNFVSSAALAAMVKRAFGTEPVGIAKMQGGYFNAVYAVSFRGGKAILKIAPDDSVKLMRYEKNLMQAEVCAINKISEFKYVPVIHAGEDSAMKNG